MHAETENDSPLPEPVMTDVRQYGVGVCESVLTTEGFRSATPQPYARERLAAGRVAPPAHGATVEGILLRREDVDHLGRQPTKFVNRTGAGVTMRLPPLDFEGGEHTRYRKILDPLFSPRRVEQWRPDIAQVCNDLIDTFIDRGECDFSNEFAFLMPATMFLRLMGVPMEDLDIVLRPRADGPIVSGVGVVPAGQNIADDDFDARTREHNAHIYSYIDQLLAERMKERQNDILSMLLDFELDGDRLTHDEVLGMVRLLFIAGLDTVNGALQVFFAYLATHPEQRRLLVERPDLTSSAVEEMLRHQSPVSALTRLVAEDTDVAGMQVRAGDRIAFSILAANLDDARYPDPETVDFERNPNPHIAFGTGIHRCAGSHLARVELRTALEEWHKRIPDYVIRPHTTPTFTNNTVRHVELQLAFPPAG